MEIENKENYEKVKLKINNLTSYNKNIGTNAGAIIENAYYLTFAGIALALCFLRDEKVFEIGRYIAGAGTGIFSTLIAIASFNICGYSKERKKLISEIKKFITDNKMENDENVHALVAIANETDDIYGEEPPKKHGKQK